MRLDLNSAATGINADLRQHFERPLQVLMGLAARDRGASDLV